MWKRKTDIPTTNTIINSNGIIYVSENSIWETRMQKPTANQIAHQIHTRKIYLYK